LTQHHSMSTPRSSALSKSTSGALITPQKPPLSLNKQVVLEEDEYTAAISSIISRDFFPSLAHLDATNSYLSALDSQDTQLIEQSVRRLAELGNTPQHRASWAQHTPYARTPSDTPLRTPSVSGFSRQSKRPRYDTSLSLDAFQAKYTSEDNASFTDILDEENRRRKEKWWWAWEAERKASERKAKELQGRERLLLEARGETLNDQHRIEDSQTLAIEASGADEAPSRADGEENKLDGDERPTHELVIRPKLADTTSVGTEPVDVMAPRKDTRVTSVPGWRFKVSS
jgi:protein DGCR14